MVVVPVMDTVVALVAHMVAAEGLVGRIVAALVECIVTELVVVLVAALFVELYSSVCQLCTLV